uniref:G_PROTEIN_RECEP_F1_2 domain-containing protein n=1 Tax=Panagrellus redivivus TaxID=6233 RepID=A0A7E4VIR4_PANRE
MTFWKIQVFNLIVYFAVVLSLISWIPYGFLITAYFGDHYTCSKYRCHAFSLIILSIICIIYLRIGQLSEHIHKHRQRDLPRDANGVPVFPPVFQWREAQKISPMA